MTISNIYRNRTLNEISEGDVGAELKVAGWIDIQSKDPDRNDRTGGTFRRSAWKSIQAGSV